jgi:hypothetical protein
MDQVTLLWWITGIYLIVLVVVLAYATISVAFYAVRIHRTFKKLAAGLTAVRDHSVPLADKLSAANVGLGAIAGSLSSARDHLVATDAGLAILTGDEQEKVA